MNLEHLLRKISLFFTIAISAITILAISGTFTPENIRTVLWTLFIIVGLFVIKNILLDKQRLKFNTHDTIAIIIALVIALTAFVFHHDFSEGRDEMVHLVSAVQLSEAGSLLFKDPAGHTFSGFYEIADNTFTSQFLPGFIAVLAFPIEFFGLDSAYAAGPIIVFFGLLAFYFTAKNIRGGNLGLIALSFISTIYTTLWFTKRLNSELLFFTLFWIALWYFFYAIKSKKYQWYFISYAPLTLLLLVRGEAFLYIGAFTLFSLVYAYKHIIREKSERFWKKRYLIHALIPTTHVAFFAYYVATINDTYFYTQIENFRAAFLVLTPTVIIGAIMLLGISVFLYFILKMRASFNIDSNRQKILFLLLTLFIAGLSIFAIMQMSSGYISWSYFRIIFSLQVFASYFLGVFALLVCKGLYDQIFTRKSLYLVLFALPSFIFLFEHNIAPDQPWFMRRFFTVLIPVLILLAAYSFQSLKTSFEAKVGLFTLIIATNLIIALPAIGFSENVSISKQLKDFSKSIKNKNALVLMEPGWSWQKWAYPIRYIYDVNIIPNLNINNADEVFISQLEDITAKYPDWKTNHKSLLAIKQAHEMIQLEKLRPLIDKAGEVYVLTPSSFSFPNYDENNMELINNPIFTYTELTPSTDLLGFIKEDGENLDVFEYQNAFKNTPPKETEDISLDLLLLKVKNPTELTVSENMSDAQIVAYRKYIEEELEKLVQ